VWLTRQFADKPKQTVLKRFVLVSFRCARYLSVILRDFQAANLSDLRESVCRHIVHLCRSVLYWNEAVSVPRIAKNTASSKQTVACAGRQPHNYSTLHTVADLGFLEGGM